MKEVIAVIRMNKMNATKKALTDAGIAAFFAHECFGRGKGLVDPSALDGVKRGVEEAVAAVADPIKLYPKRMLTVVVPDEMVDDVVSTIMEANRTGQPGDGKIFVLPVSDSVRVRTGESGTKAIV
ncbi:P-II family nitrogen regulator [Thermodesulfomicrobium sp. WS]|uniref:P-II family nitrogen regulator n=1 Tax=Thermodesulfomicrobium sp. WS TaxID=3004129 RepID=UPI002492C8CD|nr:P-II family nitrogen regulator [Thermodesulfomicrobium sp. WS]BDV00711.1 P-II family nitrogen regulator [Thermodesulfomicrobium sp. WS]